jgi:FdhD protein
MNADADKCSLEVQARSFQGDGLKSVLSEVCVERTYSLWLNGRGLVRLVASPSQLQELGAGFVITEGLAGAVDDVQVMGSEIHVYAQEHQTPSGGMITESSGGIALSRPVKHISSDLMLAVDEIFWIIKAIVSDLWQATGGAHCSVLFSNGRLVAKASDVGRHNTVDKVIGAAVLGGMDLSRCILGCTGRQPEGMVAKAARAGIPVIVSKAATTQKGVDLAERSGVTLICRVKDQSFTVYTHAQRIVGLPIK